MGDRIEATVNFGERLAEARKRRGITQGELGKRVGIGYQQVGRYESGTSKVDIDMIHRLAAALGVSVEDLVA